MINHSNTIKPRILFNIDLIVIIGLAVLICSEQMDLLGKISLGLLGSLVGVGSLLRRGKPFTDADTLVIIILNVLIFSDWVHPFGKMFLLIAALLAITSGIIRHKEVFFDPDMLTITGLMTAIFINGINTLVVMLLSCVVIGAVVYVFITHKKATNPKREEEKSKKRFYCQVEALKKELSLKGPKK